MNCLTIFFSALVSISSTNFLQIPKFNVDSIAGIDVDMQRAHAIEIGMKNGSLDTALFDKGGGLRLLKTAASNAWITIGNPKWTPKKGNCGVLLCSLRYGMCKCEDVVADSGFYFWKFCDSIQEGGVLLEDVKAKSEKKNRKTAKQIIISEEEMTKRFLDDFNKSLRIF